MAVRTQPDGSTRPVPPDPYRIPRDRATDQSNEVDRDALGLGEDPNLNLGSQVTAATRFISRETGRPSRWRNPKAVVVDRSLDTEIGQNLAPGTIRRNIIYPPNGIGITGLFSWAANKISGLIGPQPAAMEPPRVPDYYQSTLFLGLPDPAPWVTTGDRPQPGLAGFQSVPSVQAYGGTGWPVLAPQVPSFGSRVPLRRPRNLLAGTTE